MNITDFFVSPIAAVAAEHLRGIPWTELEKTAPVVDGKPEPIYSLDYITEYMDPAFEAARAVYHTLDFSNIDWESEETLDAYIEMKRAFELVEGDVLTAIYQNQSKLLYSAMRFDSRTLQLFVLSIYLTALNGLLQHAHLLPQKWIEQGGSYEEMERREDQAMEHASLIVTLFEIMVKLDSFHVLGSIKKNPTAGLGVGPAVIVGVVVAGIAAIALVAWAIVSLADVSAKNIILGKLCWNAEDPDTVDKCVRAAAEGTRAQVPFEEALTGIGTTAVKWVVFGGLAATTIYFLPTIVRKVRAARA